jgi:predicted  nucleic acid-binding Zn-ribbon protein
MSLFFLRGSLRKILGVAQETSSVARKNRDTALATLKEIYAMSQTIDNLNTAVDAAVTRLEELSAEVADLKTQIATEVMDAVAEQAAADKLTAAVVANPV